MAVNLTLSRPSSVGSTDDEPRAAADAIIDNMGDQTLPPDSQGNVFTTGGNLIQSGAAVGPNGNGDTSVLADDTQHYLSLAEQYAVAQRDSVTVVPSGESAEQSRSRELLHLV
jgi:hypothetical protein